LAQMRRFVSHCSGRPISKIARRENAVSQMSANHPPRRKPVAVKRDWSPETPARKRVRGFSGGCL